MPKVALSLILGGALGNLIDRALRGSVVDFLDFDFPDFIMNRWPIFNLADSAVSIGITLLFLHLLFFESKYKKSTAVAGNDTAAANIDLPHSGETAEGTD